MTMPVFNPVVLSGCGCAVLLLADDRRGCKMRVEVAVDAFDRMLSATQRLTSSDGHHSVGVATRGDPGATDVTLVGHFETDEDAGAALAQGVARQPADPSCILNEFNVCQGTTP